MEHGTKPEENPIYFEIVSDVIFLVGKFQWTLYNWHVWWKRKEKIQENSKSKWKLIFTQLEWTVSCDVTTQTTNRMPTHTSNDFISLSVSFIGHKDINWNRTEHNFGFEYDEGSWMTEWYPLFAVVHIFILFIHFTLTKSELSPLVGGRTDNKWTLDKSNSKMYSASNRRRRTNPTNCGHSIHFAFRSHVRIGQDMEYSVPLVDDNNRLPQWKISIKQLPCFTVVIEPPRLIN